MINFFIKTMRQISLGVASSASQDVVKGYEEAVRTLNTLQSNAMVLEKIREERDKKRHMSLPETIAMTERAGIPMSAVDELSIIHVSGTKGKGSTCAFCESILKSHGYKTGFFSSPHLVEVRERIRINGQPLSRRAFSSYFWDCYNKLDATKDDHNGAMPPYFRYLTIMAFHVFLQEKVDVAILEVGIGGSYDCTNIIRKPVACGVSSLGLDHTSILGDTLPKIAWHKAGIFKSGVPAVTVGQSHDAMDVLVERANELGSTLTLAPPFDQYTWPSGMAPQLGIPGTMQNVNASLALQLCKKWLDRKEGKVCESSERQGEVGQGYQLSPETAQGLLDCRWLGRSQTIRHPGLTYYLDGAHTSESIKGCSDWFMEASSKEAQSVKSSVAKILVFNTTGDRKPETLLSHLLPADFDCVIFCPNIASICSTKADQMNHMVTLQSQLQRCATNRNAFLDLLRQQKSAPRTNFTDDVTSRLAAHESNSRHGDKNPSPEPTDSGFNSNTDSSSSSVCSTPDLDPVPTFTFNCIQDALQWASQGRDRVLETSPRGDVPLGVPQKLIEAQHLQILCTGSLHLVGGVIGLISPIPDED